MGKFDLTQADWQPYMGNNHNKFPTPSVLAGGGVSFAYHLGKPLSQYLWEDLVHRLQIRGLCVYAHGMSEWCLGWGGGHCIIRLDSEDNVRDIHYSPRMAW